MIELYQEIRLVYIATALASGGLFLWRRLVRFARATWAMAAPIRFLTYTIDTVLLAAALMLMTIVQQYPFVHAPLTVMILLLAVCIVLGILAFRKGRARAVRGGCWLAALAVYAFIIPVARARDPLGFLRGFTGT